MAAPAELALPDLAATAALAGRLAGLLRGGDVIGLSGPLGIGKSELARAVIRTCAGAPIEVPSPTFTLIQDYPLPGLLIRHVDLYRIGQPDELIELGLDQPASDEAWLVEWPEQGGAVLSADRLDIELGSGAHEQARRARITAGPTWQSRLPALLDG